MGVTLKTRGGRSLSTTGGPPSAAVRPQPVHWGALCTGEASQALSCFPLTPSLATAKLPVHALHVCCVIFITRFPNEHIPPPPSTELPVAGNESCGR